MNGSELELFVSQLEGSLLPPGFTAEVRRREYNADGVQIAEFDVIFSGRLGSATASWLIECRDRPADGKAPASWLEQLVGRRQRFRFDKVMAVSTTGFAPGAIEYAREAGIALRTAARLVADDFLSWFRAEHLVLNHRSMHLTYAKILISDTEPPERAEAASEVIRQCHLAERSLFNRLTGETVPALEAFSNAVNRRPHLWPSTIDQDWTNEVEIDAIYPIGNQYEVATEAGMVAVPRILFRGTLAIRLQSVPFTRFMEYADDLTGERIAASVAADFHIDQRPLTANLDRITIDGADRLTFRVTPR